MAIISATLNVTTNAARLFGERVADLGCCLIMCPAAAHWQGRTAQLKGLMVIPPGCGVAAGELKSRSAARRDVTVGVEPGEHELLQTALDPQPQSCVRSSANSRRPVFRSAGNEGREERKCWSPPPPGSRAVP